MRIAVAHLAPAFLDRVAILSKVLRGDGGEPMHRRLIPLGFLAALAAAAPLAAPLAAQRELHTVRGVVRDTDGAPVAGAEVTLISPRRVAQTDSAGRFRIDSVPAGERRLQVRRIGYLAVNPLVAVPQAEGATLQVLLLQVAQQLDPIVVETDAKGIRGVVGDTGYRALPGTLVELLGSPSYALTDSAGRFAFEDLKKSHYVMRVSRVGYLARLIPIDFDRRGQELSVFLIEYQPGLFDWANSGEAPSALSDLSSRLAMEPRRTRMTRAELEKYGTAALCEIPRLRVRGFPTPSILFRGVTEIKNASLCQWSADQVDLLEWGDDPCREATKSIAARLNTYCGPTPRISLYATPPAQRVGWVAIWPRG